MKRCFIIFMAFAAFCSIICNADVSLAENKDSDNELGIEFVQMLDLFKTDSEVSDWDENLTRGELAQILCNVSRLKTYNYEVFAKDVNESDKYYSEIMTALSYGLLTCDTNNNFNPLGNIKLCDVAKVLVTLSGYSVEAEYKGGYPSGYMKLATSLGILKNIKYAQDRLISLGDLATLIYNLSDVEISEPYLISNGSITYTHNKGNTVLTEIMGYRKTKGIVEDNGITSLTGESVIGKNCVKINGIIMTVGKNVREIENFIAMNVIAYSVNTGSDRDELRGFIANKNMTYEEFDVGDFQSLSLDNITFMENDKKVIKRITQTPIVIYNGKFIRSFDEQNFDYDYGTVRLISKDSNRIYDTIIIEGYVSWYVTSIDKDKKIYTDKNCYTTVFDNKEYDCIDLADENVNLRIFNEVGKETDLEHIYPLTLIDICKNEDYIKIIIPPKALFGVKILEISDNKIKTEDKEYEVSEKYIALGNSIPKVGSTCNLFVNSFGVVAGITLESTAVETNVGYFIAIEENSGFGECRIKVLQENNSLFAFEVANKVKLTKPNNELVSISENELYKGMRSYSGIFSYNINKSGEINEIDLPSEVGQKRENQRFGCIFTGTGYYEKGRNNIDGKVIVDPDKTKVFVISPDSDSENERYMVTSMNEYIIAGSTERSAYNFESDSLFAQYITVNTKHKGDWTYGLDWFVVTKIVKAADADGNLGTRVYGYNVSGYPVEYSIFGNDEIFKNVSDATDSGNLYDIKVGDIIQYCDFFNEVKAVRLFYRSDMENVTSPSGNKGNFAGTIGYYDPTIPNRSNPFRPGTTLDVASYTAVGRTILGYAYNIDTRGFLSYTTQDLSYGDYNTKEDSRYFIEAIGIPSSFCLISYKGDKVNVSSGTQYDIRTYKNVGTECSKIIIYSEYGIARKFLVINGQIGE